MLKLIYYILHIIAEAVTILYRNNSNNKLFIIRYLACSYNALIEEIVMFLTDIFQSMVRFTERIFID